jgi:hypothetical protein
MAVLVQGPLVGFDQAALPDGGDGLEMGKIGRAARQPKPPMPAPTAPELTSTTFRPVDSTWST